MFCWQPPSARSVSRLVLTNAKCMNPSCLRNEEQAKMAPIERAKNPHLHRHRIEKKKSYNLYVNRWIKPVCLYFLESIWLRVLMNKYTPSRSHRQTDTHSCAYIDVSDNISGNEDTKTLLNNRKRKLNTFLSRIYH